MCGRPKAALTALWEAFTFTNGAFICKAACPDLGVLWVCLWVKARRSAGGRTAREGGEICR